MTARTSHHAPLAFGGFLTYLRQQGFVIGVDHHLRLHQLLSRVGAECAPQELKMLLCPLFATSAQEQALFYRAFEVYFALFARGAAPQQHAEQQRVQDTRRTTGSTLRARWYLVVLAVALVLGSSGVWFYSPLLGSMLPRSVQVLLPKFIKLSEPSPPPLPSEPSPPPLPSEPSPPPLPSEPSPPPRQSPPEWLYIAHTFRATLYVVAVLVSCLCFVLYEGLCRRRARMAVERIHTKKPPTSWPLQVGEGVVKEYHSEQFFNIVRGLRQRQVVEWQRLDLQRTMAATLEAGGYPSLQYRPATREPEYLVLIDRCSLRDHQAQWFDTLVRSLEREELFVVRYFYERDPRVCWTDSQQGSVFLADIQNKYPTHRLVIFGNGAMLLDPLTGELMPWSLVFCAWQERALLTPEPPASWGRREHLLAQLFTLFPATLTGLDQLADYFAFPVALDDRPQDQSGAPKPPDPDDLSTIPALQSFLGEETFQWLCACAVYPELSWNLTLYVGTLPGMGTDLVQEQHLHRLTQLPWFRTGSLPDALRLQLIRELDPQQEHTIRTALVRLIENNLAPAGTLAAEVQQLDLITQRAWLNRSNPTMFRDTVRDLQHFPPSELSRDATLVHLVRSTPVSPPILHLPRRLWHLLYQRGMPVFGLKTTVRALMTVTMMAIMFTSLEWLDHAGGGGAANTNKGEPAKPDIIDNRPPVARLAVPPQAQVGEAVPIDASASADPDGDSLTYTFDFGDGSAPAQFTFPRTTHSYAKPGNHTVKVTVDDGRSGTSSATAPTTIILRFVISDRKGKELFNSDEADLTPAGKQALNAVLRTLKERPSWQIHITGHTDNKGSDVDNIQLSQRRAEAVAAYLVQNDVPRRIITTDARGKREPVATNNTDTGRAQNRRVEITAFESPQLSPTPTPQPSPTSPPPFLPEDLTAYKIQIFYNSGNPDEHKEADALKMMLSGVLPEAKIEVAAAQDRASDNQIRYNRGREDQAAIALQNILVDKYPQRHFELQPVKTASFNSISIFFKTAQ